VVSLQPEALDHGFQKWLDALNEPAASWKHVPGLARDDDAITSSTKSAAHDDFALALTVHVGGVEEIDAGVVRRLYEIDETSATCLKHAANTRAAEAEFRNLKLRTAEPFGSHAASIHDVPAAGKADAVRFSMPTLTNLGA
jgi:hypothetical protein